MSSKIQPVSLKLSSGIIRSPGFILVVGILAVSSASLFIRYAQREMPSLVIAAYRLGLASIIMTPWVWRKHKENILSISKGDWARIATAGLLLAFHFASWITSLEFTSVSSSVVLVTTTPIWVALFSPFILKEKPNRMTLIGLAVAILGGIIVSLSNECELGLSGFRCNMPQANSNTSAIYGNALALLGAVCAAFYLIIGRILRKTVNLSVFVYCIFFSAAVFLVLFAILTGNSLFPYSTTTLLFCLALAVFPQIVGHTSLNWALGYLPVGLVAIVLLGEPVGSTILAAIFLKEIPASLELAGGVIILTGIFLASRK